MPTRIEAPGSMSHEPSSRQNKDHQQGVKKRKRGSNQRTETASPSKKHKINNGASDPSYAKDSNTVGDLLPEESPFCVKQASIYLPIAPISQQNTVHALCAEHLSPLLMTYHPPLRGFVMSYHNPRCCSNPDNAESQERESKVYSKAVDEYAASYVWLTVTFVLFRPQRGDSIDGFINLQNESGVGLICWNFFNASIDKSQLPENWAWSSRGTTGKKVKKKKLKKPVEENVSAEESSEDEPERLDTDETQGFFRDQAGSKVGGLIKFYVHHSETSRSVEQENGFLSIAGTLHRSRKNRFKTTQAVEVR